MVASVLFLSMVVLGGPAIAPASQQSLARSHMVVPTGVAVEVSARDATPSDLFRSPPAADRVSGLVLAERLHHAAYRVCLLPRSFRAEPQGRS